MSFGRRSISSRSRVRASIQTRFWTNAFVDVAEIGTTKFQMTVRVAGTDEEREYLYESQTPRTNAAVCRILRGIRNGDPDWTAHRQMVLTGRSRRPDHKPGRSRRP